MNNQKEHWENVYQTKKIDQVSWFQTHLEKSLELITGTGIDKKAKIIDVGGGASTLPEDLLKKGHSDITILDISAEALNQSKKRLGEDAAKIKWLEVDILKAELPKSAFDLWHDRAVFHFLIKTEDRQAYLEKLKVSLKEGGFAIMAAFSREGPLKCSGLDVQRYTPETMNQELGASFALIKSDQECHKTPFDTSQEFVYCLFKKL